MTFQNLHVIQKMGAEKVQWAQYFIDRGFQGLWKLILLLLHPVIPQLFKDPILRLHLPFHSSAHLFLFSS